MAEGTLRTSLHARVPFAGASRRNLRNFNRRTRSVATAAITEEDQRPEVKAAIKISRPKKFLPDAEGVLARLLPEVEGDAKDWFWMIISTVVFVYLAACLFMIYAHLYYKAGFVTMADLMAS